MSAAQIAADRGHRRRGGPDRGAVRSPRPISPDAVDDACTWKLTFGGPIAGLVRGRLRPHRHGHRLRGRHADRLRRELDGDGHRLQRGNRRPRAEAVKTVSDAVKQLGPRDPGQRGQPADRSLRTTRRDAEGRAPRGRPCRRRQRPRPSPRTLNLSATDPGGAGVRSYDVKRSVDGGAFKPFAADLTRVDARDHAHAGPQLSLRGAGTGQGRQRRWLGRRPGDPVLPAAADEHRHHVEGHLDEGRRQALLGRLGPLRDRRRGERELRLHGPCGRLGDHRSRRTAARRRSTSTATLVATVDLQGRRRRPSGASPLRSRGRPAGSTRSGSWSSAPPGTHGSTSTRSRSCDSDDGPEDDPTPVHSLRDGTRNGGWRGHLGRPADVRGGGEPARASPARSSPRCRRATLLVVDDNSPDGTGAARRRARRHQPAHPRSPPAGQGRPRAGLPRRLPGRARRRCHVRRPDGRRLVARSGLAAVARSRRSRTTAPIW